MIAIKAVEVDDDDKGEGGRGWTATTVGRHGKGTYCQGWVQYLVRRAMEGAGMPLEEASVGISEISPPLLVLPN